MMSTQRLPGQDAADRPLQPNDPNNKLWTAMFQNFNSMVRNSVKPSSQATYATGWKRWAFYTCLIGTDVFLQLIPLGFKNSPQHSNVSFEILACANFLTYLIQHPIDPVEAPTSIKYLTAVRYNLKSNGMDIAFMDNSVFLQACRSGVINEFQGLPGTSIADRQTIPVTIGMLEAVCLQYLDMQVLSDQALYTALIFSYTFLCRVSEYLQRPTTAHHLLSQSVDFWIAHPNQQAATPLYPYLLVPACDVWQYNKAQLLGVSVTIKDSKNDPAGAGQCNPIARSPVLRNVNSVYDISEVLFDWAIRARPIRNAPFFSTSIRRAGLVISAATMNKFLQTKVATHYGFNPKRLHSHSLRYGGASAMLVAGISDSIVMQRGRWKSLAMLNYIRTACHAFAGTALALADRTNFTADHLRSVLPAR
jgi:hypothetical protein